MNLVHYLLVFDHKEGHLVHQERFDDPDAAVEAYAELERKYHPADRVEVVLIGSDSIETIKRTHANYFDGSVAKSEFLTGI